MLESSKARIKLLKLGFSEKTIKEIYIKYNDFTIVQSPIPLQVERDIRNKKVCIAKQWYADFFRVKTILKLRFFFTAIGEHTSQLDSHALLRARAFILIWQFLKITETIFPWLLIFAIHGEPEAQTGSSKYLIPMSVILRVPFSLSINPYSCRKLSNLFSLSGGIESMLFISSTLCSLESRSKSNIFSKSSISCESMSFLFKIYRLSSRCLQHMPYQVMKYLKKLALYESLRNPGGELSYWSTVR